MKDWDNEVRKIKDIYNAAWEKNWGFVPMTDREFDHLAKDLKMILIPELTLIAEVKGERGRFLDHAPRLERAIKVAGRPAHAFGLPIGLAKMLLKLKKIKSGRLAILGIKQGFRKQGSTRRVYLTPYGPRRGSATPRRRDSWTLEDNHLINRAIETMGGRRYKTYRIWIPAGL